jgi:hypothetical protein
MYHAEGRENRGAGPARRRDGRIAGSAATSRAPTPARAGAGRRAAAGAFAAVMATGLSRWSPTTSRHEPRPLDPVGDVGWLAAAVCAVLVAVNLIRQGRRPRPVAPRPAGAAGELRIADLRRRQRGAGRPGRWSRTAEPSPPSSAWPRRPVRAGCRGGGKPGLASPRPAAAGRAGQLAAFRGRRRGCCMGAAAGRDRGAGRARRPPVQRRDLR